MRIVVLQHSVTNQRIFHNVLAKGEHGPIEATADPLEARQLCAQEQPVVLIAGKELVAGEEEVLWNEWEIPEARDRIAIIVTGYQFTRDEAIRFIQEGADELLILPFQPEQLEEKLRAASSA
jgi:DNA-binding NtrC family response regulator